MKIVVILNEQYPNGMAASNRTHLYSRGLAEIGNDVNILIPRPTEKSSDVRNITNEGVYQGVKYRYAYECMIRKTVAGRKYQNIMSFINCFRILTGMKPDIILVVCNELKINILAKISSLLTGAKIVREKTEVPYYRQENLNFIRKLRIRTEFRLFDGLMVISPALKQFFQNDMSLKIRVAEVPIIIDSSQEKPSKNNREGSPLLVYTGSLLDHKDGVTIILKAFAMVVKKHPSARLIMAGDLNSSPDKVKILSVMKQLRIDDKTEFTGYVSKERLHEIKSQASMLVVAKPMNRQNRYNMATKTGEYLLTEKPIVISSVDPICNYLTNHKNACICQPDEEHMAAEFEFLLENNNEAELIGKSGKKIAMEFFDYRKHVISINDFFNQLKRS
jgi:glycosyltransferase involved in cell wall biosynthesis